MRRIPATVQRVIDQYIQTEDNRSKLTSIIEVKRPETLLTNDYFIEDIKLNLGGSLVTDVDICVGHPMINQPTDRVYIAAIVNGKAKVYMSDNYYQMEDHKFVDIGVSENATSISICYDSTLVRTNRGSYEKITNKYPYLFYVDENNALYCLDLKDMKKLTLATENIGAISAVSGVWHESNEFDYGTMLFYTMGHKLWVRRCIKGKWYNPEVINALPDEVYNDITATLTWDYRVAVTCKSTTNTYILFSNFLGFGKFTSEKISIGNTHFTPIFEEISKPKLNSPNEMVKNLNLTFNPNFRPFGETLAVSAKNTKYPDDAWGHRVEITFDTNLLRLDGSSISKGFTLKDSNGREIISTGVWIHDNNKITAEFKWFHDFEGTCTISFNNSFGTIINEYNKPSPSNFSVEFVPTNLSGLSDPSAIDSDSNVSIKSVEFNPIFIEIDKEKLNNNNENIRNLSIEFKPSLININDI